MTMQYYQHPGYYQAPPGQPQGYSNYGAPQQQQQPGSYGQHQVGSGPVFTGIYTRTLKCATMVLSPGMSRHWILRCFIHSCIRLHLNRDACIQSVDKCNVPKIYRGCSGGEKMKHKTVIKTASNRMLSIAHQQHHVVAGSAAAFRAAGAASILQPLHRPAPSFRANPARGTQPEPLVVRTAGKCSATPFA